MSGLMKGNNLLFPCIHYPVLFLQPSYQPVDSLVKFLCLHYFLVFSGGQQGSFIDKVGQVGSYKTRSKGGDLAEVHIGAQEHILGMDLQDCFSAVYIRAVNQDLPVNSPGTSKAGSRISGRLVAAMMMTPLFDSNPSISTRS